jgi:hypothetical protein
MPKPSKYSLLATLDISLGYDSLKDSQPSPSTSSKLLSRP